MEDKYWDGSPILASDVLAEAKRLSVEFPERIGSSEVSGCVYTEHNYDEETDTVMTVKPVCIVGTAIYNLTGKFVPQSMEGYRIGTSRWMQALSAYVLDNGEPEFRAWQELDAAQGMQDRRVPWGRLFAAGEDD